MKNVQRFSRGTAALQALCLALFVSSGWCGEAVMADTPDARVEKVLYVHNVAGWSEPDLVASHAVGAASVRIGGAFGTPGGNGFPAEVRTLPSGGSGAIKNFPGFYAGLPPIGVLDVVVNGSVDLASELVYGAAGNRSFLRIPAVTRSYLPPYEAPPAKATLTFHRIEHGSSFDRATWFIFITDTAARIQVDVYDGQRTRIASYPLTVLPPYTFVPLERDVALGEVELTRLKDNIGCPSCTPGNVYVVAFPGFGDGGSPGVELGELLLSIAIP